MKKLCFLLILALLLSLGASAFADNRVEILYMDVENFKELYNQYGFLNQSNDMLTYVSENPRYDSMSFILCADDAVRDYGNAERTVQFKEYAEKMGWGVISMKDDFNRIYAEGIVPKFKDAYDFFGSR